VVRVHRNQSAARAAVHRFTPAKPDSINRATALALAAVIFYVPANVYPVMSVVMFGKHVPSTILGGIVEFIQSGMYPLAALIFFASIAVPMLKIFCLALLIVSVRFRWPWNPRSRTALYRVVEQVGRWSMIDVFVISILVALVKLGNIATIEPGIGASSFAAVVVVTMFAAASFDPRLIWDALEETEKTDG
jgi:paraquat-inducible protein A